MLMRFLRSMSLCIHIQMRGSLSNSLFSVIERVLRSDRVARLLEITVDCAHPISSRTELGGFLADTPYSALGRARNWQSSLSGKGTVFITSRFRSGSTLLWNVFRHLPDFTAYYEPFNERRWFDPTTRGESVDATHRNVSDYWRE